jgi:hypothetical protein
MTRVVLGNRHAVHSRDNGETVEELAGKRATIVDTPDGQTIGETFKAVTDPGGIWATHTGGRDVSPAWVASDSPGLAQLLAEHYGADGKAIEVRDLEDVTDKKGVVVPGGALPVLLATVLMLPVLAVLLLRVQGWLKTNAGNDFQAAQMGGAASATAVAKWVALTANATAPAAGDTTLTGEITTAGGGLIRKAGTYAHTTGAASYTITTVFTANGSDSLPVTIAKRGIFDASAAGNMVFETLVSPTATLSASGDSLTLTDTISL